MIYTYGKAIAHAKLICQEAKSRFFNELGKLCVEDALVELFSRDWPFLNGEGVITTVAPVSAGTILLTLNSTAVVGTATGWSASYPSPAILRAEGANGDEFLMTFTNATTGVLDKAWPYPTVLAATYTLEFPAYDIPAYISIQSLMSQNGFYNPIAAASYSQLMELRRGWFTSGFPLCYTVVPGNGTTSGKIWISPSPASVYTLRYNYRAAIPAFQVWDFGTASCSNASVNVTGSNTNWAKTGLTLPGNIFEITDPGSTVKQEYVSGTIASITNDSALVLSSAWTGRDATGKQYCISPQISFPDDMIPTFRALVESYVYARVKPTQAPNARAIYMAMLADSLGRYNRIKDARQMRGVLGDKGRDDAACGPGIPTEMTVSTI